MRSMAHVVAGCVEHIWMSIIGGGEESALPLAGLRPVGTPHKLVVSERWAACTDWQSSCLALHIGIVL